jgi:hypothetical protein
VRGGLQAAWDAAGEALLVPSGQVGPLFDPEGTGHNAVSILDFHTRLPKIIPATLVMSPSELKLLTPIIQIILIFSFSGPAWGTRISRHQRMVWMTGSGTKILAVRLCGIHWVGQPGL